MRVLPSMFRAALLLVGCARMGRAQRTAGDASLGDIHGRVVTAVGAQPLAQVTVDVTAPASVVILARVTSGTDGTFRIPSVKPGRYRVRIRAIGYVPREFPGVTVSLPSLRADLGTVTLVAVATELQSVVVKAERANVMLAPDRNTYAVKDMPATTGGTALDVLRNVPAVDVDIDNVVSLRGNAGVIVQINGRPSPLTAAQLGNYLSQLPANMIEKVEVIPNPSARDTPEGMAGIINIVLRTDVDAGTSGGMTVGGSTRGRADLGGRIGYQHGKLNLFGSYGWFLDSRPRNEAITRDNLAAVPVSYLDETGFRTMDWRGQTITGSATYDLSRHDALSLETVVTTRFEDEVTGYTYRDLDAGRALTALSDRLTVNKNDRYNVDATLGWRHVFAEKAHKLSTELHGFSAREAGPLTVDARRFSLAGIPVGATAQEQQYLLEKPDERTLKVDYVRPLSPKVRFESGYRGSMQQWHNTFDTSVLDTVRGVFQPDSALISNFTFNQTVHAVYGMLSAQAGKFQLQGGVRVEHAATQFHLATRNLRFDNRYNSVFPSALVAYNVDDAHQVKLSFSTRIRRPNDGGQLDPTLQYIDPLNVSRGNPYLKPEYIRAFELGLQRTQEHLTVQVTPFFRHTVDAVRAIRTIDGAGVTTRTFANVATANSYGTDLTVAAREGRLSGFAGASVFRSVSNAANLDPALSAKTFGWSARLNASFRATTTSDLQALVGYMGPMTVEQGTIGSRANFSLAARQKLRGGQTSLTLRLIDPFNNSREYSTTLDPRFTLITDRRRPIRGVLLNVDWAFGRHGRDLRQPEPDQGGGAD